MNRCSVAALVLGIGSVALGTCVESAAGQTYQFDYSGAIVDWVVPTNGIYRVTAVGGQGGGATVTNSIFGPVSAEGGRGARVAGTVTLNAGTTLQIAVAGGGSWGGNFGPGYGGGGGGGSFVVAPGDTPLIVAGGGGGASFLQGVYSPNELINRDPAARRGQDARLTEQAGFDASQPTSVGLGGRASRFLLGTFVFYGDSTGGAGFYGDSRGLLNPAQSGVPPVSASAWPSLLPVSGGGFGGGGGAVPPMNESSNLDMYVNREDIGLGAGGGGYTGGGGGSTGLTDEEFLSFYFLRSGYGGGSLASSLAADTFFEVASDRTGNGVVTVEFVGVPTPGAAGLLALGGVVAGRRRR